MPNLWIIFLTGLLTGGLTCMAVQGGLLMATLAREEEAAPKQSRAISVLAFLIAKLIAYTIVGLILGSIGGAFQFSLKLQAVILGFTSIFMVGTALAMVEAHPIFRYFIIQPPRFLTRMIRQTSKNQGWFSAAIVGALTIFIPCGTTQSMMALALTTGNPVKGAIVLFTFILGTAPLFFLLGYSIDLLKDKLKSGFARITATIIILLAIWNLNSALVLGGSKINLQNIWQDVVCTVSFCENTTSNLQAGTTPTVTILSGRYEVDNPVIAAGQKIQLTLVNTQGGGCIQAFTIPSLGVQQYVPRGQTKTIEFTAPNEPGVLQFSCSMGMYTGRFIVK